MFFETGRLADRMLAYPTDAAACSTIGELEALATECVALAGVTAIASGMVTGPRATSGEVFHFNNWPAAWRETYVARGFMERDPIPRWAIVSGAPALWSEVVAALPAGDPGHEVFEAARAHGFHSGMVNPVRTRAGHLGLVSVGGGRPRLTQTEFHYLQAVCTATLHRAEALCGETAPLGAPNLSRRERECVALLVQGLTEREISARLCIREVTTRFHLDNARLKTGARSRTHLAGIAAQWLGRGQ